MNRILLERIKELSGILKEMSYSEAIDYIQDLDSSFPTKPSKEIIGKYRRKLAKKFHPDIGYSGEELKTINDALDTISKGSYESEQSYTNPGFQYSRKKEVRPERKGNIWDFSNIDEDVWAWAGYSGGVGPMTAIFQNNPKDMNYVKKKAWEISGKKRKLTSNDEYGFQIYDGHFFRYGLTVFANDNKDILEEIAKLFLVWGEGRYWKVRAIVISNSKFEKNMKLIVPVYDFEIVSNPKEWKFISSEVEDEEIMTEIDRWFKRRINEYLSSLGIIK